MVVYSFSSSTPPKKNPNKQTNYNRHLGIDYEKNGIAIWNVILDYETIIFL